MKKGDAWMPLYVGDYLADTMHLAGPDHGAYLLLLMHSWRTGPLRDDERALAAVARTDLAAFRALWPTLREFFVPKDGAPGFLISPRLEHERERAAQHIDQRRAAGKASAAARARQRESNDRSTSVAVPLEREGRPSPSPSPSLPYPKDKCAADAAAAEIAEDAKATLFTAGLSDLVKMLQQPEVKVRPLIGKMLSAAGQDAAKVLEAVERAKERRPADPLPWLMAALKPKAETTELPAEINGYVTAVVVDRVLDELGVGEQRFPELSSVVMGLLREGHEPDSIYASARSAARRGVETMRSAGYLASIVRARERDRRDQSPKREPEFNWAAP